MWLTTNWLIANMITVKLRTVSTLCDGAPPPKKVVSLLVEWINLFICPAAIWYVISVGGELEHGPRTSLLFLVHFQISMPKTRLWPWEMAVLFHCLFVKYPRVFDFKFNRFTHLFSSAVCPSFRFICFWAFVASWQSISCFLHDFTQIHNMKFSAG